ncbi:hypothetical protein EYF80_002917 [Liparis tanakae]|uniref:Uncharacterized protein n=1 Tax=Liparis tanakae TaxID=230148 RepID=A0A4Z2JAA4_9TELE|nr:hypothetical protein EYF80_002917 [Liparis tanakae]
MSGVGACVLVESEVSAAFNGFSPKQTSAAAALLSTEVATPVLTDCLPPQWLHIFGVIPKGGAADNSSAFPHRSAEGQCCWRDGVLAEEAYEVTLVVHRAGVMANRNDGWGPGDDEGFRGDLSRLQGLRSAVGLSRGAVSEVPAVAVDSSAHRG